MGWFESFREPGWGTYYGDNRHAALFDVNQVIVVFCAIVFVIAIAVIVIGSRDKERWLTLARLFVSLQTGIVLLICLTGQEWKVSSVTSECEYVSVIRQGIKAKIGVHIGLKSVNITLKGHVNTSDHLEYGSVNYNERFSFDAVDDIKKEYGNAKHKGLPWPILYVLEYFDADGGGLRWCRGYREAGHFVYILLWCAFVAWAVANIMIGFVITRGASLITLCGIMMLAACTLYATLQPSYPMVIPFADAYIRLHFGWCFYLCIVSGVLTVISGIVIFILQSVYPEQMALLLLVDTSHIGDNDEHNIENLDDKPLELDSPYSVRRRASEMRRKSLAAASFSNPAFENSESADTILPPPPYSAIQEHEEIEAVQEFADDNDTKSPDVATGGSAIWFRTKNEDISRVDDKGDLSSTYRSTTPPIPPPPQVDKELHRRRSSASLRRNSNNVVVVRRAVSEESLEGRQTISDSIDIESETGSSIQLTTDGTASFGDDSTRF